MSATLRRVLSTALCAALVAAPGLLAAENYVPPAHLRIHVQDSPRAVIDAVHQAGGEIIDHGKGWVDALLPQDIARSGAAFSGLQADVRVEILEEDIDRQLDRFRGRDDAGVYHTFEEVQQELQELQEARPDLISVEVIGRSWEDRPIYGVRIGSQPDSANLPTFLVCGMHHSREWIAVEVPMGLIHMLVEQYDSDPAIRQIVDSREVWVVPVMNPDGFVYSQTNYRMWRKNRRDNGNGSYGVDPNRNWGYQWGNAGTNPSSDTYQGPEGFSEPETRAVRDLGLREKPVAAVSYHSYGELVLWPWSYTYTDAPDHDVLGHYAREFAARNGYDPKQSSDLYPSSGDFDDWFYGVNGALSFTIELGRSFIPPESQVPGIVEENLEALRYWLENCSDPFPLATHSPLAATTRPEGPFEVALTLSQRYQADDPVASAHLVHAAPGAGAVRVPLAKDGPRYVAAIAGAGYGEYRYHFEVTEGSGRTHRFPREGEYSFQVVEQLYLLVDDDQGKGYEDAYEQALRGAGLPFSTVSSDQLTREELLAASGVIWSCGEDSSSTLTDDEQALLQEYLGAGGELLLFGQDIGYDLKGSSFMKTWLRADFEKDDAGAEILVGEAGTFLAGLTVTINQGGGVSQKYPEAISPREGAAALLGYQGRDRTGAVAVDDGYRLAYFGIGLEGIDEPAARQELLARTLGWMAEDGAARKLVRARALRALGGAESRPRDLARLESEVLEAVRELGRAGDEAGMKELVVRAGPALGKVLYRTYRQAAR